VRDRGVAVIEHARQVGIDHGLPFRQRHVRRILEQADAGVVHEHVEAAESIDRFTHRGLDLGRLPHVGGDRNGARPELPLRAIEILAIRPVIATEAPADTSARAIANPIPFDPPVTSATIRSSAGAVGEAVFISVE
jgi:hypothetical protein